MNTADPHPTDLDEDVHAFGMMPIFGTLDDVCALAQPIGVHRAKKIFTEHPLAPKPILGGNAPGAKAIHSMRKAREFWQLIAEQGLQADARDRDREALGNRALKEAA